MGSCEIQHADTRLRALSTLIGQRTEIGVVMPAVMSAGSPRGHRPGFCVGALRPTVGNAVRMITPFSVHYPVKVHMMELARELAIVGIWALRAPTEARL